MKNVIVYRDTLLPVSELFILSQGEALQRYQAQYFGLWRVSGICCPPDRTNVIGGAGKSAAAWRRVACFKLFGLLPRSLRAKLEAFAPVLVHAHFGTSASEALSLARTLGVPCVVTWHGYDATVHRGFSDATVSDVIAWLRRGQMKTGVAAFIAVSDFIAQSLRARGYPAHKIVRHYTGIDVAGIPYQGKEGRSHEILFVGRLVDVKGGVHLLDAMALVCSARPSTRLIVIGDGPLRAHLQQKADSMKLDIHFLGTQPSQVVIEWMRRARVLAFPSVRTSTGATEGLGMVALEGMASGLPLVASRSGGIPEVVVDGETGLLCAERDAVALAKGLRRLLDDDELWTHFSEAGRRRVEQFFDLKQQTSSLERLYDHVIETARGHRA